MRQVVIPRHGGPGVLRFEEVPLPQPGPGQLRIAVSAAGINFADILIRQGVYPGARPPPCVPGHEISGVVDEVGDGVDPMWKGRPVLALGDYGGYAQYHVIDADRVLPKPADLEFPAAAGLPLNYVTAWLLLIVMGSLRGDQTLLIQNAVPGKQLLAVQMRTRLHPKVTRGMIVRDETAYLFTKGNILRRKTHIHSHSPSCLFKQKMATRSLHTIHRALDHCRPGGEPTEFLIEWKAGCTVASSTRSPSIKESTHLRHPLIPLRGRSSRGWS